MASYLAETSTLTRLTRSQVRKAIQPYIDAVTLARCHLSDLELGFSASNLAEWDRLQALLDSFVLVAVTPEVVSRAKIVQRSLADRGLKGRKVPDLLIAAAAELSDMTVLHYDRDFEIISSVTGQPHEWVVPRGAID